MRRGAVGWHGDCRSPVLAGRTPGETWLSMRSERQHEAVAQGAVAAEAHRSASARQPRAQVADARAMAARRGAALRLRHPERRLDLLACCCSPASVPQVAVAAAARSMPHLGDESCCDALPCVPASSCGRHAHARQHQARRRMQDAAAAAVRRHLALPLCTCSACLPPPRPGVSCMGPNA
jgi:hypothetical protein